MNPAAVPQSETSSELSQAPEMNISAELVTLIRGIFSAPVISGLGRLGFTDVAFHQEVFGPEDFKKIPNKKLLADSFEYLVRLALLKPAGKSRYQFTELGKQIFQRLSSFYAPHSYRYYVQEFMEKLAQDGPYKKSDVDRYENIIGSGRTHERYFPMAVSYLKRKVQMDWICDIGCGDGRFLEFVLKGVPGVNALGVDLSEVSVKTTADNLKRLFPDRVIDTTACDGADVAQWSQFVKKHSGSKRVALSMWFLWHEISRRNPENVIRFIKQLHAFFPESFLVVGELVRQDAELLAQHRSRLLMPEYVFFHDISEQGVLSWKEYRQILEAIPYELAYERTFDEIGDTATGKQPATFVWCLKPR